MNQRLCGTLIALGLCVTLAACDKPADPQQTRLRTVKTITVGGANVDRTRTFSGVSKSSQETRLSFKVSGSVEKLPVSVGDSLQAGQLIAQLDDSIYQLQAQQAQADLARAQAEERNASSNYQRVQGLYENSNASRNELDTARASFESGKAQVNASRRALDLARLNIAYTKLKAGEACSVASLSVEVGENVSTGQEVAMVTCGDEIEVELTVPENLIASLYTGQTARVVFDAVPDRTYAGNIREVGVAATGGSTFPVTIALNGAQEQLRSGMAAQVSFDIPVETQGNYTVPAAAVGEDKDGRFVFLVDQGNTDGKATVRRQPVRIGELTTDGIEIIDGLSTGDIVVTAGLSVVRDGLAVKASTATQ